MPGKNFTLMIVPEGVQARVRRVQIPKKAMWAGGIAALALVFALVSLVLHYAYVIDAVFEARTLRQENAHLKDRLTVLSTRIDDVDGRLDDLRVFDEKLRNMTGLHDTDRGLALGPLRGGAGSGGSDPVDFDPIAVPLAGDDPAVAQLREALLDSRLAGLGHEANRELQSLAELVDHFSVREVLLETTPSIAPARGLLTSGFGAREDPFTGSFSMHSGLDIAAREGTEVIAPANGVVIFAGEKTEYGQCIIVDYGRDLTTLFAHLSRILVKPGDKVKRGQHVGNVGNTGRSTGPHLHYEVRINGVPVNPRRYVVH